MMHSTFLPLLLLLTSIATTTIALPDIFLGTIDTCFPIRYNINYAAWLVKSHPCAGGRDSSSLTLIGAYPVTGAGCGLENSTVGGFDNITFTGCAGPGSPYPTAVLRNGKKKLECAPVRKEKEDRFCESEQCQSQGRKGVLKTVLRCRKTRDCE